MQFVNHLITKQDVNVLKTSVVIHLNIVNQVSQLSYHLIDVFNSNFVFSVPDDYCEQDQACSLGRICENNRCIGMFILILTFDYIINCINFSDGCRNDANCRFEESCINKQCQNTCELFGACGQNALCKPMNHDRVCTCSPDYTGDPRILCERILPPPECFADSECPSEHICKNERCTCKNFTVIFVW